MKSWLKTLAAVAVLACGAAPAVGEVMPSGLEIRQSDYAADRAAFSTRLLRRGPSPQRGAPPATPAGAERVSYASGGLSLAAFVTRPRTEGRAAVVIFLHGGFAFGGDDFEMPQPFRDAGYAVVTPLLRGENGQPGTYSMFYDEVDDVLAVLAWVKAQPWADPDHIYLAGHSVGGTMALLSSLATDQFRAVVSMSGSPDQIVWTQGGNSALAPFDMTRPDEFAMRSPASYVLSLKSPTRLYYGTQEPYFREMTEAMVAQGRQARLDIASQTFPGDHFGAVPAEIKAAIAFFKAHR